MKPGHPPRTVRVLLSNIAGLRRNVLSTRPRKSVAAGTLGLALLAVVGGARWSDSNPRPDIATEFVKRAPFKLSIVQDGVLESAKNVTLVNEVEWPTRILSIVPEGTRVKAGDVLCELDRAELDEKVKERQVILTRLEASLKQAKDNAEIQRLTNERNISQAKLAIQLADLDLRKFREGDFKQQCSELERNCTLASETLNNARGSSDFIRRMVSKGYRSYSDLDAARLAATKAEVALANAQERLRLYKTYSYNRSITELEARYAEAQRQLERVKLIAEGGVAKAKVDVAAIETNLGFHKSFFERLQRNVAACVLRAPAAGEVVYASKNRRSGQRDVVEEGAQVRRRQELIKLPDLSRMRVETRVHESRIGRLAKGQTAKVHIDAFDDRIFEGRVTAIAAVPSPGDWPREDDRSYETVVEIVGDIAREATSGLSPGLTAKVEIEVEQKSSVLQVPVTSVVAIGGTYHSWVMTSHGPEARAVEIGDTDDSVIEIVDGLTEGEQIVSTPRVDMAQEMIQLEHTLAAEQHREPDVLAQSAP